MRRKNPILLPGKELWAIHFEPLKTGQMSESLKRDELKSLFSLATLRGWLEEKEAEELLSKCSKGDTQYGWSKCKMFITALNPKEEQEGQAIASWLILYNIVKYNNLLRSLRPPYTNLRIKEIGKLRDNLLKAIKLELLEKKYIQECRRHFLGILLCDLCSAHPDWKPKENGDMSHSWNTLKKELHGKEHYNQTVKNDPTNLWILTPSHGFQGPNKWILPSISSIDSKIKELYNSSPIYKNASLEKIRQELGI